jgi:hypothetical protein
LPTTNLHTPPSASRPQEASEGESCTIRGVVLFGLFGETGGDVATGATGAIGAIGEPEGFAGGGTGSSGPAGAPAPPQPTTRARPRRVPARMVEAPREKRKDDLEA